MSWKVHAHIQSPPLLGFYVLWLACLNTEVRMYMPYSYWISSSANLFLEDYHLRTYNRSLRYIDWQLDTVFTCDTSVEKCQEWYSYAGQGDLHHQLFISVQIYTHFGVHKQCQQKPSTYYTMWFWYPLSAAVCICLHSTSEPVHYLLQFQISIVLMISRCEFASPIPQELAGKGGDRLFQKISCYMSRVYSNGVCIT